VHEGRVAFGNIGSVERQDFTVIGQDVNLVARLGTLAAQLAERVTERAEQVANDVLDETETLATEVRVRPTLSEAASGVAQAMVLNAALLVDLESERGMGEAVEDMARELEVQGFELVLSGPWPPFTFSEPEDVVDDGEPAGLAPQESSG